METSDHDDPIDQLIAKRLARLGGKPVDTSQLEQALRAQIPVPISAWRRRLRPTAAVAASLIIVSMVSVALFSTRNVQASPSDMAQMYRDMVSGKMATMKVDSMEQANQALAAFAGNFPQLSEPPEAHAMACCMHNIGNKKVACILLNNGSSPVTMVVANSGDVQKPSVSATVRDGQTYYVQTIDHLQMVMTERQHHWICLIGEVPADKLVELSGGLKFSGTP